MMIFIRLVLFTLTYLGKKAQQFFLPYDKIHLLLYQNLYKIVHQLYGCITMYTFKYIYKNKMLQWYKNRWWSFLPFSEKFQWNLPSHIIFMPFSALYGFSQKVNTKIIIKSIKVRQWDAFAQLNMCFVRSLIGKVMSWRRQHKIKKRNQFFLVSRYFSEVDLEG